ncbi:MAG: hypothetical protein H7X88_12750, partial [Gloeobacteraceae cyanobacterium ES-bin-316]|nr:hypothetical protein [Ferruginibacter sp.]
EKQDIELRKKGLGNDEHIKQRDALDKVQERAKDEMQKKQAEEDKLTKENLKSNIYSKDWEIEKKQQEQERIEQRERDYQEMLRNRELNKEKGYGK